MIMMAITITTTTIIIIIIIIIIIVQMLAAKSFTSISLHVFMYANFSLLSLLLFLKY